MEIICDHNRRRLTGVRHIRYHRLQSAFIEGKLAQRKNTSVQTAEQFVMVKPVRLYCNAVNIGYKRSLRNQHPQQSRLKIEGVNARSETAFYLGKRVAYIFKAPTEKKTTTGQKSRYRVMWGKIIAPHGNSGVVKAKFRNNLPPTSIGKPVRVMLYPSAI